MPANLSQAVSKSGGPRQLYLSRNTSTCLRSCGGCHSKMLLFSPESCRQASMRLANGRVAMLHWAWPIFVVR
eukprot:scaffold134770_cov33-Tisochrysis_lutea.AAC.2